MLVGVWNAHRKSMPWGGAVPTPCTQWSMRAYRMVEMVEAHAYIAYRCCTICMRMVYGNHCHRLACSIMLQLGSRAPIVIGWPAVVLVIWPHFNGNAQRRPRSASLGLALFSSRICWFLCTSHVHGHPRGKSNRPRGFHKIGGQIPYFLVGGHWRFPRSIALSS